jgi:phosphatidylinositol alpha-1,6-mannosyltransferase
MNILVLTSEVSERNGWGTYSLQLVRALKAQGENVTLVSSVTDPSQGTYRLLPPLTDFNQNYFLAYWYAWKLRSLARSVDVIHAFVEPYSCIAEALSRLSGKPYFVTVHGTYGVLPYGFGFPKRQLHAASMRGATAIICVSSYTKERMHHYGLRNLHVVTNAIDTSKFENTKAMREELILTVGALKRRKGQHVSLEAFALLKKKHPHLRYVIVGDQSDTAYFKKLTSSARELQVADSVEFKALISPEELRALYQKTKVFVMTSLNEGSNFEGFGLVYLEANACGTPVVGSRSTGAEDAIQDGKTGFLVSQHDPEATAGVIDTLLSDEVVWSNMSAAGELWARQNSWEKAAARYAKIYRP